MSIKSFAIVAAVAAGTVGFAGTADAQVIVTSGGYYNPGYVYPATYTNPYYGGSGVILSSGSSVYPGYSGYSPYYGSGYNPYYGSGYTGGLGGYNNSFYTPYSNAFYSGYNNLYNGGLYGVGVGSRGVSVGGRRAIRW